MAGRIRDIGLRAASAVVLAPAAVAATWAGGVWFLGLMVAACVVLAFEWAAMSAPRTEPMPPITAEAGVPEPSRRASASGRVIATPLGCAARAPARPTQAVISASSPLRKR